jgi:drug/metabolite transporter (DMT)-like permease
MPEIPDGRSFDEEAAVRAANRFDIRRIIGAVFALYGVVLVALGVFGAHHIKVKASGININLWTGLGMLVVSALMIGWALLRPVRLEPAT